MKPMANHSSAGVRETPHAIRKSRTNTIVDALKRRAHAVLNDRSIDPQSRAIIRYALEINDPWLARLVRRAEAGEAMFETLDVEDTAETDNGDSDDGKIAALTEIICRAGDEPDIKSAGLFVLMATIEKSAHPKALASAAKYGAFIRCAEMNPYNVVDAQVEMIERELFADSDLP
jgi:hypothetical protein